MEYVISKTDLSFQKFMLYLKPDTKYKIYSIFDLDFSNSYKLDQFKYNPSEYIYNIRVYVNDYDVITFPNNFFKSTREINIKKILYI